MNRAEEVALKRARLRELLAAEGLDAVALSTQANFAWYTAGGSNRVVMCSDMGAATILADGRSDVVLTDNIEAPRIEAEELGGLDGFELVVTAWHDEEAAAAEIARRTSGRKVASDSGLPGTVAMPAGFDELTYSLTPGEIERYRALGLDCAEVLAAAGRSVEPGMSEDAVAAELARGLLERGVIPWVVLVAADERAMSFRHPTPTARNLRSHLMMVICGRRHGLILSATRMVHFGELSGELRRKHDACVAVDAALIAGTRPERPVAEVFADGVAAYEAAGFGDEWRLHHQGGPTGYQGRSYKGRPAAAGAVLECQAYAWNPSITGTKSEDTVLARSSGVEILSSPAGWPTVGVEAGGTRLERPDILVR